MDGYCEVGCNQTERGNVAAILNNSGSAQESDEARNLGCFLEYNEFGSRRGHPLGLEQEITQVLVATATT